MSHPAKSSTVTIQVGGISVAVRTQDASFRDMLTARYTGFVIPTPHPDFELDVELIEASAPNVDDEVQVTRQKDDWTLHRGDFRATWNARTARGKVFQAKNPYAIDSVLRIVHTLILAPQGGFLVHAASAIRNGRAFVFAGISGAGKTTISRLAPPDAQLLTDEVSYIRCDDGAYSACGTPFAGELARVGENCSAPIQTLFLLAKSAENRIGSVDPADAVRELLRHILFFAVDPEMVKLVFQSACRFVDKVPVRRLSFTPDPQVWEIIG
jgi:hypothetical protein